MLKELRASLVLFALLALLTALAYPFATLGLGQALFKWQANGSLVMDGQGRVSGSILLAQGFAGDQYFHPRPSAAGNGYDAANSGGSNLAATSADLLKAVEDRAVALKAANNGASLPVDLVTASASGLDPDISVASAQLQAARVASARHEGLTRIEGLIAEHTHPRTLGILGEPRVNVLELNRALDGEAQPLPPEEP